MNNPVPAKIQVINDPVPTKIQVINDLGGRIWDNVRLKFW
jgi:hypothetical protein